MARGGPDPRHRRLPDRVVAHRRRRGALRRPGFTATGTWTALTKQSGRFAGTLRQAGKAGAALSLKRSGSTFVVIADRCTTCGKVKIYVDGVLKATIDTYARSTAVRQQIWSTSFSSIGTHTAELVVAGTPKRPTVRIDGLIARR